jgi:Ras-related protein Rab-21
LLRRYVFGNFQDGEQSTQNAAYLQKVVWVKGVKVELALWDTAGQEKFHSLAPMYYRDAHGALLVYDTTDMDSFKRVSRWVEELRVQGRDIPIHVVGNKIDLKAQQKVKPDDAKTYSRDIGATSTVASAKTDKGVEETFVTLVESILDTRARPADQTKPKRGGRGRPAIDFSPLPVASKAAPVQRAPEPQATPAPRAEPQTAPPPVEPEPLPTPTPPPTQSPPPASGQSFKLEPPQARQAQRERRCCA